MGCSSLLQISASSESSSHRVWGPDMATLFRAWEKGFCIKKHLGQHSYTR